jgi:hypothetical protein
MALVFNYLGKTKHIDPRYTASTPLLRLLEPRIDASKKAMLLPTAHSTSASKKIKLYSVPFVSVSTVLLFRENSRGYIL